MIEIDIHNEKESFYGVVIFHGEMRDIETTELPSQ